MDLPLWMLFKDPVAKANRKQGKIGVFLGTNSYEHKDGCYTETRTKPPNVIWSVE